MKLFHLSDLHLGKRLCEVSLLDDQAYILDQILELVRAERPDAVLLCGDVYDKPTPPEEAVRLLDGFLVRLAELGTEVFLISGNHDSAQRLSFGGRLMEDKGVHIAPVYRGQVASYTRCDAWGEVRFWLLPFLRCANVNQYDPDCAAKTCTEAIAAVLGRLELDPAQRNVLLAHQFVTGASRAESERIVVGGEDNVDLSVFAPFDYVALGHLHSPQRVGQDTVRYCGTPLKYSLSEAAQQKSVTVVELGPKGEVAVSTLPLRPLRDLRPLAGSFADLIAGPPSEDYLYLTLTDETEIPEAMTRLRRTYPNALQLRYDNTRTRRDQTVGMAEDRAPDPFAVFSELFEKQNNQPMRAEQAAFVRALIREIWEEAE